MTGDCGIQIVAICLETRGLLVVGFQEMQPYVDLLVDLDLDGWVELTASGEELFDVSRHSSTQNSFVLSSDLDEPVEFAVATNLTLPRFLLSKGGISEKRVGMVTIGRAVAGCSGC
jgi:hypothetical protein